MNLRELLTGLRAGWWLGLLACMVGGGAALGLSLAQTPLYTASTQLFVSTNSATFDAFEGSLFSQQRVGSYVELIGGQQLAERVVDRLDLDATPAEIRSEITAEVVTDTVLI